MSQLFLDHDIFIFLCGVNLCVSSKSMKTSLLILSVFTLTQLKAQTFDKNYIINWIKAIDTTYKPDSVIAYYIDRGLYYTYDTTKFNAALRQINVTNLKSIFYSKIKTDNYVPGRGSIYISTIKKLKTDDIKGWLTNAKKLFVDNYISFSQHIFTDAKDPVLIIDKKSIQHTEVKETLNKLNPKDIYDISVSSLHVPASIYGQNSKNGLVQIWTKKFMNE